jgi:thiosulfate/3-mercaptopyruvate sulfurtransferase
MTAFGPLISAEELAGELGGPDLAVIDIRWSLADRGGGRGRYMQAHIPGAVFVDLEEDITGAQGAGRHPLPSAEQLEAAMRRAGVDRGDRVVVYDDAGGSVASRLWWLLRAHGHEKVAVLDGGIDAWRGPLESGVATRPLGDFVALDPDRAMWLDREEVGVRGEDVVLLDVRAPERYAGEIEPVDPLAGHIPGARNAFWQGNLGDDGRFLPADALRARYQALGASGGDVVTYCGSGVNACHAALAVELAGLGPARVYAGSWSDWCSAPDAPVATGADP